MGSDILERGHTLGSAVTDRREEQIKREPVPVMVMAAIHWLLRSESEVVRAAPTVRART
jgi:hypothetical protein